MKKFKKDKIKRERDTKEIRELKSKIRRRMIQKVKPSNKIYKRRNGRDKTKTI